MRRRVIIVKRGAGWLARALVGVVILALIVVWLMTQTDFGRNKLRLYGLRQLAERVHGVVRIGEVHGDLLTGATLVDVLITDSAGGPFLRADTIQLRYARKALFQKHIVFQDVRLARPVVVFDQPPGGEWNVERLFRGDTIVAAGDTIPGWGDWVRLENVQVVQGDVTVRRAWSPPTNLTGDALGQVIDDALSERSRQLVERVPGGYQAISSFHEVYGGFPLIRFADPDSASRIVDVDSLRMIALPFRPPAAEVKNLVGRLVVTADSIGFERVRVRLPASTLQVDGAMAFGTEVGGAVRLQGAPVELADLRFLRPSLPAGGGRADLTIDQNEKGTRLVARELDVQVEGATLEGTADVETGPSGTRVHASDLTFAGLDTRTVERLAEGVNVPLDGVLAGHVKLSGVADDLTLDGTVDVRERSGAVSRIAATGGLRSGPYGQVAENLRLRFDPLRLSLVRQADAQLPVGGTLTGTAAVNGPLSAVMTVNADLVHEDPAAGRSHVLARGGLRVQGAPEARALRLELEPLQARLVKLFDPTFPVGGTFRGHATVSGLLRSWLSVDADLVHEQPRVGRSHVVAVGDLKAQGGVEARRLRLRFDPLQTALVREFAPDFKPDGVLVGTAVVNGSPTSVVAANVDLTHRGSTGLSTVAGDVRATLGGRTTSFDVDIQARPLSLATAGLFAPAAGLRGSVTGPIRARGTTASATFDAALDVAGGGRMVARGTVGTGGSAGLVAARGTRARAGGRGTRATTNAAAAPLRYDVVADLTSFDAARVTTRAPSTSFTGAITARGVGTDPATMTGFVDAALVDSRVGDRPAVDSTRVRARFDAGLLTVERGVVRMANARADVSGTFGLTAARTGTLRYRVTADSLARFKQQVRQLAAVVPADSGIVQARPMAHARELRRARLDSAKVVDQNLVERVATGRPTPAAVPLDTVPMRLRRDSIAGAIDAQGALVGNLRQFDARGTADLREFVFNGTYVGSGRVDYDLAQIPTSQMCVDLDARLARVRTGGFVFDSASATVRHQGGRQEGSGMVDLAVFQDSGRDYRLRSDYTLHLDHHELHLRDVMLRFDSTRWTSTQPGTIRWAGSAVELEHIELANGKGGRMFANGRLPTEGSGDLRVRIDSLQIADFAALIQDTVVTRGLLSLNGTFHGTARAPVLTGTLVLDSAARAGQRLPSLRGTFDYADLKLTGHVEALDGPRRLLAAEGQLPVDLAFRGVSGARLRNGPVSLDVQADSFPLEILPQLSPEVQNLSGRVRGTVTVRGTKDDPQLGGELLVQGASAYLPTTGLDLRDGTGVLRLAGDVLTVDTMTVNSGGGPIAVRGTVALETLTNPELDLSVEARNAQLLASGNEDEYRPGEIHGDLRGDVSVTVGGSLEAPRVIGTVDLTGGVIQVPEPQKLQRATRLDDPQLVGIYESLGVPQALRPRNRLLETAELDIAVRISRDTWLRNTVMNVEVYTPEDEDPLRVTIDHTTQRYALEGVIHADRGDYTFAGREFKLSTGSVTFLPEQPDPILQLSARHEVPRRTREALVILVNVSGTLKAPKVALSSNVQPPIPESDLLSFLAFGQESSALLTGEGSGIAGDALGGLGLLAEQQLAGLGLGALTQVLVSNLETQGMKAGLDVFRIRPRALPDELNFAGYFSNFLQSIDIEAGEYLTPNLFAAIEGTASATTLPGLRVEYVTPRGFSWITTWEPGFKPPVPTLDALTAERRRVFGSFLTWQRRF